ncbi:MAG: HDIG domain-containing protein [Bacteroidaceae bacterium]|nr:HDIG domain-containing protein [Bacteroidaceae bacterium]
MKPKKIRTKKLQEQRRRQRLFLFKSLLVVVSAILIVYLIPRHNEFSYNYELNQPWRYGALLSSQKFNILMSDSAITHQRDSIVRHFSPYFLRDTNAKAYVVQAVKSIARKSDLDSRTVSVLISSLDSIYGHGIMSSGSRDSLLHSETERIRVVTNNIASLCETSATFTPKTAYQFVRAYLSERLGDDAVSGLSALNLDAIIAIDLTYDAAKNRSELEDELSSASSVMGFVSANEKIVDRGDIVTGEVFQKLRSYQRALESGNEQDSHSGEMFLLLGQSLLVLIILSLLVAYLSIYRTEYLEKRRCSVLLFSLVVIFFVAAALMVQHRFFHIFIMPCCMLPIIIRIFLDSRTAFTFHCATVILISLLLSNPYDFIILQMIAGLIAILDLRELTQRSQIIHAAVSIIIVYVLSYCAYQLATGTELKDIEPRSLAYFVINGVLLLFTYPLLWLIEKMFGFVSDVTLVELSNINHPLLRQLSEEAPGTFQHSLQVANLAADVAKRVNAKVQLVRTGALYHDIGKTDRPVFFTENQNGASPHKHMSSTKSAEVIIAHVRKGLELADKYGLPQAIKDFISTHHGLGKTKYFLVTYRNEHPDETVDESLFTYPGPNPQTKEEAILMMSDAVEAASRSLPEYTEDCISSLVERIVDGLVAEGFFRECPITFRDIHDSKDVFRNRLMNIYHTRISYPELQSPRKD